LEKYLLSVRPNSLAAIFQIESLAYRSFTVLY